jgi:hypothetical protein
MTASSISDGPASAGRQGAFTATDGWRRRTLRVAAVSLVLGLAVFGGVPLCPSAAVLRTPCPGCGLTRATLAMLQGRWDAMLALNPAAPLVVPLVSGVVAWILLRYVTRGDTAMPRWLAWPMGLAFAVLMIVWVARQFGALGGPVPV